MDTQKSARSLLSLLSLLGFSWAIVLPIAVQPFVTEIHRAIENRIPVNELTLVVWVVENLQAVRLVLYGATVLTILVATYCWLRSVNSQVALAVALATSLVVGSITIVVMTLLGFAVALG